jgi:hypothetical protein
MLKKMFGLTKEKVTLGCRAVRNEERPKFYSSLNNKNEN